MDLRLMLSIGIGLFAVAMYLTAGLTNQAGYAELFVPQALRGAALMLCYLPANHEWRNATKRANNGDEPQPADGSAPAFVQKS
jgi:hypothetical protein